jgi:hypothetical protein
MKVELTFECEVPDEDISESNDALWGAISRLRGQIEAIDSSDDMYVIFTCVKYAGQKQ